MDNELQALVLIISFASLLAAFWLSRSTWSKGQIGERKINKALKRHLDKKKYRLLADLTLPTRDGETTQIDHVVISQYGIFVIETKNMSGWIFGDIHQAQWTQVIFKWRSKFQNPLRQNFGHVKTVQHLLELDDHQVHNLVAFVGTGEAKTELPPNIVWSSKSLVHRIRSEQSEVIQADRVDVLVSRLSEARLRRGSRTNRQHIENVANQISTRGPGEDLCPRCGAKMRERTNKRTGHRFLGCSKFPRCRGARKLS